MLSHKLLVAFVVPLALNMLDRSLGPCTGIKVSATVYEQLMQLDSNIWRTMVDPLLVITGPSLHFSAWV